MQSTQRSVFVLEVRDRPCFAFEADCLAEAEELSRTAWFARAVAEFCTRKCVAWDDGLGRQTRAATIAEASLYHDLAEEFCETTNHFLVVHLRDARSSSLAQFP